jgi:predicted dehydrogenase
MNRRKLKIAFIGTGTIAKTHLDCLKELSLSKDIPNFEVIGHISPGEQKRDLAFSQKISSIEELIKMRPDAVYLCTPPFARFEYESKLLKNNINYFVEKPPTFNYANNILKLLDNSKSCVGIGMNWRYFHFNHLLKELIRNDNIGFVSANRFFQMPFKDWKLKKEKSGGIMLEVMFHAIDYCSYILESCPQLTYYHPSSSTISKNIDSASNLPDSEILIFSIGDTLCNFSGTNYTVHNNYFLLNFVGVNQIYQIRFEYNKQKIILEVMKQGEVIEKYSEDSLTPYKQENLDFILSLKEKNSNSEKYKSLLHLSKQISQKTGK